MTEARELAEQLVRELEHRAIREGCWSIEMVRPDLAFVSCDVREHRRVKHLCTVRPGQTPDLAAVAEDARRGRGLGLAEAEPPPGLRVGQVYAVRAKLGSLGSDQRIQLVESSWIPRELERILGFVTADESRERIDLDARDPGLADFFADPTAFLQPLEHPRCPACGLARRPSERLAAASYEVMGAVYDETIHRCECGTHAQVVEREGLSGESASDRSISTPAAEERLRWMRECADPLNARCPCEPHQKLAGGW